MAVVVYGMYSVWSFNRGNGTCSEELPMAEFCPNLMS